MSPHYVHDCRKCVYLTSDETVDWYRCADSIIGRTGDDGPDYWSAPIAMLPQMIAAGDPLAIRARMILGDA